MRSSFKAGLVERYRFATVNETLAFYKWARAMYHGLQMDPRIQRTRDVVLPATLSVLADRGFAAFTMEGVAEASGVAKSTLYRHWPTKLSLIREALEGLNRQPEVPSESGSARARIERLLEHLASAMSDSVLSACIPALIEAAEHHPEVAGFLHEYTDRRRSRLVAVIRQGIERGELSGHLDPELAGMALSAPIFYRRLMTGRPMQAAEVPRLVEQVLGPT